MDVMTAADRRLCSRTLTLLPRRCGNPAVLLVGTSSFVAATSMFAQVSDQRDVDKHYRFPLSVAVGYRNLSPFARYGPSFSVYENNATVRRLLPKLPVLQPILSLGALQFVSTSARETWNHTNWSAELGPRHATRMSTQFEVGAEVPAGYSEETFPKLLTSSGTLAAGAQAVIRIIRFRTASVPSALPAVRSYYVKHPVGTVTRTNIDPAPIKDLSISFNRKAGAIVTPADGALRNCASSIRQASKGAVVLGLNTGLRYALPLYGALGELGFLYQPDPTPPSKAVQTAFQQTLSRDPSYPGLRMNLVNPMFLRNDDKQAVGDYLAAEMTLQKQGLGNSQIAGKLHINISKTCHLLVDLDGAQTRFAKARAIDSNLTESFASLETEASCETTARAAQATDTSEDIRHFGEFSGGESP